jgi:hypothetical protein
MKKHIILIFFLLLPLLSIGQYNQYYPEDSTKAKYPYTFPIFGNFLHDVGIDLPYPVGIMVNSYMAEQNILITDIAVGFEGGEGDGVPLTDVTRLLEFEDVVANAYSLNFRPDVWVLPFLNVYGIVGKAWTKSDVIVKYPFDLNAVAELNGMTFGVGLTFAGGFKDYFMVLDVNNVWTYMSNFEEPVKTRVLSPRFGKTFKLKKAESNFGIWVGAMSVKLGGVTTGSIGLKDVLPPETWENRDQLVEDYYNWYESIDEMKQNVADKIFTPIVENIASGNGDATVLYSLTKESKAEWNMLLGGQYQLDKHWQIRTEFGFLGERKSWLLSANYRFGIKHK